MARLNHATKLQTHEGGRASHVNPQDQLRRSVLSCLLWERTFYEDGKSIAERIQETASQCSPEFVSALAIEARNDYQLRHAPLWLALNLINRGGKIAGDTLAKVIQRPDEITEFLAMYWGGTDRKKARPITVQTRRALGAAFNKFDEYQLAKWNRDGGIKLKDALFLCHAKPKDEAQAELFKKLIDGKLAIPNTWETRLSAGENKGDTFTDLLQRNKMGYIALLMNLRNMTEAGVDRSLIRGKLLSGAENSKALPFRFVAAARACPSLEPDVDEAMQLAGKGLERSRGTTAVLVDVSGSMGWALSDKSTLNRIDAACALAVYAREVFTDCRVFSFSQQIVEVPARKGMALIDAISTSQLHGGTYLAGAIHALNQNVKYDRIIVVTDEQSHDGSGSPLSGSKAYLLNVASYENGVGYGQYTHINGWSDSSIKYIQEIEKAAS